jgi:tRNA A-37 threonylcarbamoyl transferase component Bud32
MIIYPFELFITQAGKEEPERVLCKGCLRTIPGNRDVYDGQWNGGDVVVKVFSRKIGAKHRLKREWEGLIWLRQRGVNSPQALFCGRTDDGRWAVATEKIADAASLMEVYRGTAAKEDRVKLLKMVAGELAVQHEKGIVQKDLHLGNFLLKGDKLVVLDPGRMRFFSRPVGRRKSISQLALLAGNLGRVDAENAQDIWREYFKRRRWHFGESDVRLLQEQTAAHKKNWIRRTLKKCMRTSMRFLRIRTAKCLAVFDRKLCERAEPVDFLEQIDKLMEKGDWLKQGNTSGVSRLRQNGRDICIKRYNHKGLFHSLRHTIKGSRARKSWLYGHRLMMLGIATPKPLAYIERRKGPLVWKSYLVTEYVNGQNLHHFLRDKTVDKERCSMIVRQILEMLERMQENGIIHRDLKQTNILITANGPVLTDLDAIKTHKLRWISRWKGRKYINRLKQNVSNGS